MNAAKDNSPGSKTPSKNVSRGTIRLMKWIVLIVLLVLLLLALFLPDRGLAAAENRPLAERCRHQLSPMRLPTASSTPSENRMRRRSPSIS